MGNKHKRLEIFLRTDVFLSPDLESNIIQFRDFQWFTYFVSTFTEPSELLSDQRCVKSSVLNCIIFYDSSSQPPLKKDADPKRSNSTSASPIMMERRATIKLRKCCNTQRPLESLLKDKRKFTVPSIRFVC